MSSTIERRGRQLKIVLHFHLYRGVQNSLRKTQTCRPTESSPLFLQLTISSPKSSIAYASTAQASLRLLPFLVLSTLMIINMMESGFRSSLFQHQGPSNSPAGMPEEFLHWQRMVYFNLPHSWSLVHC